MQEELERQTAAKYGVDYAVYKEPLKDNKYKYYIEDI
jgi:hypothetical protein